MSAGGSGCVVIPATLSSTAEGWLDSTTVQAGDSALRKLNVQLRVRLWFRRPIRSSPLVVIRRTVTTNRAVIASLRQRVLSELLMSVGGDLIFPNGSPAGWTLGVAVMSTILCVDDDPVILELQKRILETNGYTVLIARDGPTGITLAATELVDMAVLDFKMPGMDGDQVAEELLKQRPDLPLVICTGFFDSLPEWLKWFAAACVHKGDGPAVLLTTIQEVLAKRKIPAQASEDPQSTRRDHAA